MILTKITFRFVGHFLSFRKILVHKNRKKFNKLGISKINKIKVKLVQHSFPDISLVSPWLLKQFPVLFSFAASPMKLNLLATKQNKNMPPKVIVATHFVHTTNFEGFSNVTLLGTYFLSIFDIPEAERCIVFPLLDVGVDDTVDVNVSDRLLGVDDTVAP